MLAPEEAYGRLNLIPREFQKTAWRAISQQNPHLNVIIAAGTGSGKTEAAFVPALESKKRILALFPTKALLQDQLQRIQTLAGQRSIAIDTGDEDDRSFYHSDVVMTNIDKFLFRLFGYGKKRWSYLYPYRIGFAGERQTILILDEAHAYEDVAFSHFWFLLKKLTYERRVQTVILSATLPPDLVKALEDPDVQYFPRDLLEGNFFEKVEDTENRSGTVTYAGIVSTDEIVTKALDYFSNGVRCIIVLDRVVGNEDQTRATLHKCWQALQPSIKIHERHILTYHGHQMPRYRQQILTRLRDLDGSWKTKSGEPKKGEPFILVTTSAMEIGVDISSDVLITNFCEPDSFVQRIGRCARRSGEQGQVHFINATGGRVSRRGKILRDFFSGTSVGSILGSKTKSGLNALNSVTDLSRTPLKLEYLQDQSLYRYIYDFVQENRELWQKGVLITRDWEPTITVVLSENIDGQDFIGGIPARDFWMAKEIKEKLLLPVSGASEIAPYCAWVFEVYNEGNQYAQRIAVAGSKERSLVEALKMAGISAKSQQEKDPNKVKAVYGLDLPLIFIVPNSPEIRQKIFPSNELGIIYSKQWQSKWAVKSSSDKQRWPGNTRSPNESAMRTFGSIFLKEKGTIELPIYWFEPVDELLGESGS